MEVELYMKKNIEALVARPCLSPYFTSRSIKGHVPEFRKLREAHEYRGQVHVQVPGCDPITMYSDNDDNVALTYFYFGEGAYESLSVILFGLLARQARDVLDVGAHSGLFSLVAAAANPVTQVHYFELMPLVAERAEVNFAISGFDRRVHINNIGVSNVVGTMTAYYNEDQPLWTGASLENVHYAKRLGGMVQRELGVTTLDTYWMEQGRPQFRLMKIDVENHELAVFEGGTEMLETCKPFLICEVLSKKQFADFVDVLSGFGYEGIYVIDDDALMIREVDRDLAYKTGEPYEFQTYHNVLFSANKLHQLFFNDLRRVLAISRLGFSQSPIKA